MTPEQETELLKDVADTRADCRYFRTEILRHSQILDGSPERGVLGLATNVALLLSRKTANNNLSETYWLRKHFGKMLAAILAAMSALLGYAVGR